MSIFVELYEFLVERGMPKKKAPGAAGARRQTQYLVTKEGQLAKRLIARPRRLSADAPAGKKRPGVKH